MKKYFLTRTDSDPKIIGVKTGMAQIEFISELDSYREMEEFFDVFRFWDKKDFSLPKSIVQSSQQARLLKGANFTDFLRFRPYLICCPFLLRNRAKFFFEEFVLPEHYFISVDVFNNGKRIEQCDLLYIPPLGFETINFSESIFYTGGIVSEKKIISVSDAEEYSQLISRNPTMGKDKIVLTNKFDDNMDFFSTRLGDMFMSSRMKERVLSEGFTALKVFDEKHLICVTK